jgi:hypothetical protein
VRRCCEFFFALFWLFIQFKESDKNALTSDIQVK